MFVALAIMGSVFGFMSCCIVHIETLNHQALIANQQALCAPYQMDHSFTAPDHTVRAVCRQEDGTLFLSSKVK